MIVASVDTFIGFPPQILDFFSSLQANNSREWFAAHRADYEGYVLEPARALVVSLGERLQQFGPDIHAEPRIYGSIFAINRDTRFSADKTPYKTHLDLWFWQGSGPSRERPGYFFRLNEQSLILGAGMHAFSAEGALERYRQAVLDPVRGARLEQAAEAVGLERIRGRTYQRVPAMKGSSADHPRANWLRHSGLYVETEQPVPPELFSASFPDLCFEHYRQIAPVQQWLAELQSD